MSYKKFLKEYFNFGKKDRIGIMTLCTLILLVYFLPHFFSTRRDPIPVKLEPAMARAVDSLSKVEEPSGVKEYTAETEDRTSSSDAGALFVFDPNTISAEGWKKLGLNEKTTGTILKYRAKGGKFREREDLQRIWGLPKGFYERVKSHIQIEKTEYGPKPEWIGLPAEKKLVDNPRSRSRIPVNLNEADTAVLIELPGIGSRLASRIVEFRQKLGGFYSVDQVSETYGLSDSVFRLLRDRLFVSGPVKKIRLNSVTREELRLHPYFRWKLANALIAYREQHGSFKSLEEIKQTGLIDEALYQKLVPYLELD